MSTPNPKTRDCQDMHLPQDSGIQVSRPIRKTKFAFVDGLSNTYLTKSTRSHVMTNAYREKRKRLGEQPQTPRTLWTFDPVNLNKLVCSEISPKKYIWVSGPVTYETTAQGDEAASDNPTAENYQLSSRILMHASMQPKTILGAGTIDHFSTLPVPRTSVIDKFVATYLGPGYDYGLVKRRPTAFNYRFARFKAALDDECSFYAILIWLRRWAAITGDEGTALHCLQFKGECLHVMDERIGNRGTRETVIDVSTMYAALDLSNGEIRAGNFDASKLHWHGLREMVIAAGGLSTIVDREPLIHAILWNYMALGLDQGMEWDYIPPIIISSCPSQETECYVCAEELVSFITRLQDPEVREWFKHPVILSALHPGTLLHTALCAGTSHSCYILPSRIEPFQGEFGTDLNATTGVLAVAKHHAPPHAAELRKMQSPRPAIFVFVLNILLDIRDTTKMHTTSLTASLAHLFAAI